MSTVRRRADPPVGLAQAEQLLSRADQLQADLKRRLAAWRDGYATAELHRADEYQRGLAEGLLAIKAAEHNVFRRVGDDVVRWVLRGEHRTRETFGRPHPDDYTGGPVKPW